SHSFGGLHADKADADCRAEARQTDVDAAAQFPQHRCCHNVSLFIDVFVVAQTAPAIEHGRTAEIFLSMLCCGSVLLFMRANQRCKNCGQEHKHKCLDEPDQDFQKIKRNWQKRAENRFCPGGMLNRVRDCFEQISSSKDIAVKTKAKGNGPEPD